MGFFSQDCTGCGHPALSRGATTAGVNEWMTDVVVFTKTGDRYSGEYDGYGTVGRVEEAIGHYDNTVYHRACWEVAGKPEYAGESRHSDDQGWFFADEDHLMADPRLTPAKG